MFRASYSAEITEPYHSQKKRFPEERCGENGSLYAVHNDVLLTFGASPMPYRSFRKPEFPTSERVLSSKRRLKWNEMLI